MPLPSTHRRKQRYLLSTALVSPLSSSSYGRATIDHDQRPLLLIYANNEWDEIAVREELGNLSAHLTRRVVHVLTSPPEGWTGESGYVTADLLARQLRDGKVADAQYFICGPPARMDIVEPALIAHGVPHWRLLSGRFNLVYPRSIPTISHIWAARLAYVLGIVLLTAAAFFGWVQRGYVLIRL